MTPTTIKLRFLLPSLLGVLAFLTPVSWNGDLTIVIGILRDVVRALFGGYGLHILFGVLAISSLLTLIGTFARPSWLRSSERTKDLFDVPYVWVLLRVLGTLFCAFYMFQFGPELIQADDIGEAIFVDIGVNVIAIYITACLLLPLLTDFGFMEFMGTLARPLFRRAFRLPGRSAIDALASFVGAASVGLLITISQYESGRYTAREASVIATNFSIVSIPFCLVVASVSGIGDLFITWYATVVVTCLLIAVICPRMPPLSRKADTFIRGTPDPVALESAPASSLVAEAWHKALERAVISPGPTEFLRTGLTNMAFFMAAIVPAAMALATMAALFTFHTPVFGWLGAPFVPLLEFAQLPQAADAAAGLFSGFLDQYMPAVTASSIDSRLTSFVLAGLSVTQLIFMSEVGVIILRSSLPLKLTELAIIFLLRTAISLPMLILGAHLFAAT